MANDTIASISSIARTHKRAVGVRARSPRLVTVIQAFCALVNICAIVQSVATIARRASATKSTQRVDANTTVFLTVVLAQCTFVLVTAYESVARVAGG